MSRMLLTCAVVVAATATAQAGAQQFFTESVKDFGTTPRGPILVHYFAVHNTSGQTVTLGQPRVSCGCVTASVVGGKFQLAAGETGYISAQMDTRRIPQAGVQRTVTVYVPFLSPTLEEVHLRVQAIARDDLVLSPDTLAFGTVRKGLGGKTSTRVTFYSDPNWQVTAATSTGGYVKAAAAEVARQGSQVTYEVTATLDPACPVGNWAADVWLQTTGAGVEKIRVPVAVNVVASVAVNPDAVRFGDVKVGGTAEQRVIVQGTQPFKVTDIKGLDGQFKTAGLNSDARQVHVLTLSFAPTAPGDVSRTLEVVTDHKEQPNVSVPLTARVNRP